jgi:hypothetical protein
MKLTRDEILTKIERHIRSGNYNNSKTLEAFESVLGKPLLWQDMVCASSEKLEKALSIASDPTRIAMEDAACKLEYMERERDEWKKTAAQNSLQALQAFAERDQLRKVCDSANRLLECRQKGLAFEIYLEEFVSGYTKLPHVIERNKT